MIVLVIIKALVNCSFRSQFGQLMRMGGQYKENTQLLHNSL
jgi:hypothetical protein